MQPAVNTLGPGELAHLLWAFERGIDPPEELLEPLPLVAVEDGQALLGDSRSLAVSFPLIVVVVGAGTGFKDRDDRDGPYDVALSETVSSPRAPWVRVGDLHTALHQLASNVAKAPLAAVTFIQLLRATAGASLQQGLAAESLAYSTLQGASEHGEWLASRRGIKARLSPSDIQSEPPVVATRSGGVLRVELNRPRVHNAYNSAMRDALCEVLSVAAVDTSTSLHLSGRGQSFCSGGDLFEFGSCRNPALGHLIRTRRSPARLLAALSDRTRAVVHGYCAGSGLELAAFASSVVADGDVTIWLPEISMGLIPGAGGTVSIPRRVGRSRAAWLGLSGERISTSTAVAWGLVDGWLTQNASSGGSL